MSVPLRALLRRLSTSHGTYSVDNIQSLSGKKLSALYSSRFSSESSFSLAALLAGAGVFTVAALSPHHCEEEDTLVDNLKRLEATLTLPDPGDFKDLDQSKKIDVDEGEGLQAMVTTMIHAGEKSSFYVQHSLTVASGHADHYMFTASSDSKTESLTAVVQPTQEGTVLQAIMRKPLGEKGSVQGHFLFQGPVISAAKGELKYHGPDFTVTGLLALGQRLGGTGVGLNYFQSVTKALALGADTMFYTNDFTSIGMVGYSLYGAWQQDDVSVLGKYDRMHNDVIVRYWRKVTDKLTLGSSLTVNLEKMEAYCDVSYEMPIRLEEGSIPYTTLKGKLFLRSLRWVTSLDHMLLNGQGMASLYLSLDHFKEDYKVGVAVKLQS